MSKHRTRTVAPIAAPRLLLLTTYFAYQLAVSAFGQRPGYLIGFLFYWIGWCLAFPLWLLGSDGVLTLFRDLQMRFADKTWLGILLLLAPLLLAYGHEFPRAVKQATLPIVVVWIVISVVNGFAEKFLGRGTYARVFPDSVRWGYLYPTLGLAVWHFAPKSVFPDPRPGAAVSLVVAAGIVSLIWG